jgi:hypothetical protein
MDRFGSSTWEICLHVLAVVPVILMAFICQMALHPVVRSQ